VPALAQVTAADPAAVSWQLRHLANHPVAAPGPQRAERARLLHGLADQPGTGIARVAEALDGYWRVAITPHWPRLQALLRADIAYQLEELADGGVGSLLRNLHPSAGLSQLDLPMSTTQLATALTLSAPTLSAHLHALHRAGIVSSRRDGRAVLYSRTPLGDDLLTSAAQPT